MKKKISVETMPIFVVWCNTDLTEGKGEEYVAHVCIKEATAKRLAKGSYVQGTDANYTKFLAYKIDNRYYAPCRLIYPTKQDDWEETKIQEQYLRQEKKNKALDKAKAFGLSEEDIENLKN